MNLGKIHFIASVQEDRVPDIRDIAESLKDLGCNITRILGLSGVIVGIANAGIPLETLKIDGIQHIELDKDNFASSN